MLLRTTTDNIKMLTVIQLPRLERMSVVHDGTVQNSIAAVDCRIYHIPDVITIQSPTATRRYIYSNTKVATAYNIYIFNLRS